MSDTGRKDLHTFDDYLRNQLQDRERAIRWGGEETIARLATGVFKARTKRGMSQSALARRVGTRQPNISDIENGATNATARTIGRLAAALSMDVSELLRAEDRYGVFQRRGFEELRRRFSAQSSASEPTPEQGDRWSPEEVGADRKSSKRHPKSDHREDSASETDVALVA